MPPPEEKSGIGVHGVAKSYGRTAVLHGVDLTVRPGEFLCLLGPSGCGKTTLLRCLAGLERPDAGSITIGERVVVDIPDGKFVPPERRRLGMVFQHYALWPHMTVAKNIEYPLRKQGIPHAERTRRVAEIMKVVGLLPALLDRRPSQLSGGQQQRVALARALVYAPPVLLLDEPLSNLDATLRGQLRRELRQLHERLGTTTVLVTHDQEEAAALADTIAVMHQGRLVQIDAAADLLARPRTRFVAEFVGFDNFVNAHVVASTADRISVEAGGVAFDVAHATPCPAPGTTVVVAARSDTLRLYPPDRAPTGVATLRGTVRHVARVGRGLEIEVAAGNQVVIVREAGSGHTVMHEPGADVAIDVLHATAAIVAADI